MKINVYVIKTRFSIHEVQMVITAILQSIFSDYDFFFRWIICRINIITLKQKTKIFFKEVLVF